MNVAANIVPPAYDLVNLVPTKLNFVRAGLVSIVLGCIGGALGPVAGIMIADFFIVRRRNYDFASFYDRNGEYAYRGGWSSKALIATAVGLAVAYAALMRPESRPAAEAEPAMEIAEELG